MLFMVIFNIASSWTTMFGEYLGKLRHTFKYQQI